MPAALKSGLVLSFPIWGTLLAIPLIIFLDSETATTAIIIVGVIGVAFSSAPIVHSQQFGVGTKIGLTLLYFGGSAVLVVVLGLFLLCMHKCN